MRIGWRILRTLLLVFIALVTVWKNPVITKADGNVSLYTPYTDISVTPGQSVTYSIDVINNSSVTQTMDLQLSGVNDKWRYQLTAGGYTVHSLSVLPGQKQTVSLSLNVPLQVDKGDYQFQVTAGRYANLPLTLTVSQQGTFQTQLTSDQPNMQGQSDASFTYNVSLKNMTANKQLYSLNSGAPKGWNVQFQVDSKNVTSVSVDANNSKDITVNVQPPDSVTAGTYDIPIAAQTSSTSGKLDLQAVITGTYNLELSTPNGVLSTSLTAGHDKTIQLKATNKGSSDLTNIQFSATTPTNWNVTFSPQKLTKLAAGESAVVNATIHADDKSIVGDYMVDMSAKAAEKTADAQIRATVNTSILWGWLGILIILAVLGGIYYLYRKYGRQ